MMKRCPAVLVRLLAATLIFALGLPALAETDLNQNESLPKQCWNILLLGTDNRYESDVYGRTDSMILLSINLLERQAKLTSLMRDIWVELDGHGGQKLNAASVYGGPELTMATVNRYFDLNVGEYVLINITGLAEVIDKLGGVELTVTEAERKALNKGLFNLSEESGMTKLEQSGENVHLNGNQAVAYARIRQIDSDYRRTERQRALLNAMAEKLKQTDAADVQSVIDALLPYVETNLTVSNLLTLAYVGLQMDLSQIGQYRLPADGTYEDGMFGKIWCIKPDFEKNAELLHEFIYTDWGY